VTHPDLTICALQHENELIRDELAKARERIDQQMKSILKLNHELAVLRTINALYGEDVYGTNEWTGAKQ
jgi:hypothetical protein